MRRKLSEPHCRQNPITDCGIVTLNFFIGENFTHDDVDRTPLPIAVS